ncbi:MAG TPA: hypothetical protein VM536_14395 [Chloroflexia bacterium]|nr:hypothetical protein [Chloroflexia bacterium]
MISAQAQTHTRQAQKYWGPISAHVQATGSRISAQAQAAGSRIANQARSTSSRTQPPSRDRAAPTAGLDTPHSNMLRCR